MAKKATGSAFLGDDTLVYDKDSLEKELTMSIVDAVIIFKNERNWVSCPEDVRASVLKIEKGPSGLAKMEVVCIKTLLRTFVMVEES